MSIRVIKTVSPQGVTSFDEYLDLEGIIEISLFAYANGERSERLIEFLNWIASLNEMPTSAEFQAYLKAHGVDVIPIDPNTEQNITN